MDASRFDAFVRALSLSPSRRVFVRNAAVAVTGAIALKPALSSADSGSGGPAGGSTTTTTTTTDSDGDAVGGTDDDPTASGGNAVCLPIAKTGPEDGFLPPFTAELIEGSCDTADGTVVFDLLEVDANDGVTAVPPAAFMTRSVTTVQSSLDDLVDDRHSLLIRATPEDPTVIACGEVGGIRQGDELTVGIKERNNSGYSGVSLMRGTNGSTLVYVFLGRGLSSISTAPAAIDSTVVTTADVNVRAQPAVDSAIVTVVPTGTVLTVTGESVGEWVPIEVPDGGETGYVSGQFVEVQS